MHRRPNFETTAVAVVVAITLLLSGLVEVSSVDAQAAGPSSAPASLWAPPPGVLPAASSYVYLASFGGTVGNGAERTLDSTTSHFSMTGVPARQTLTVTGYERWQINFVTPAASSRWAPGYYSGADDRGRGEGPVEVSGNASGCNLESSWLLVEEVHYTGATLDHLQARFEQDCLETPGTALRGQLRWDASTPPPTSVGPQAIPNDLWSPPPGSTPSAGNYVYVDHTLGPMSGGYPTLYPNFVTYLTENTFRFDGAQTLVGDVDGEFASGSEQRLTVGYYPTRTSYPFQPPGRGSFDIQASHVVGQREPLRRRAWVVCHRRHRLHRQPDQSNRSALVRTLSRGEGHDQRRTRMERRRSRR